MKVLWIVNILYPEAAKLLGGKRECKSTGGWLISSAEMLIKTGEIELSVICVTDSVSCLKQLSGERIKYYVIPNHKNPKGFEKDMLKIKELAAPDIIHIHGTEMPYGYAWIQACSDKNVIVSIQGIISVISRYYRAGISIWDIIRNITIRDLLRESILGEQHEFRQRGVIEVKVIESVKHVIGRTSFDYAHCKALNPEIQYHFCNETLRSDFYLGERWLYSQCVPHTIFLSQASYPIKGLHQFLKALPIIKKSYPDIEVRIAGRDITSCKTLENRLRRSGYGRIIKRIIKENHLEKNITFTGALNAEGMKKEYLKANLFVCPSSIENSSNSLGEAQLLGVPCLVSYVGGLMDMIPNNSCGELYRFEEVEMLAEKICRIFKNSESFDNKEMVDLARSRHNPITNNNQLISIYKEVLSS